MKTSQISSNKQRVASRELGEWLKAEQMNPQPRSYHNYTDWNRMHAIDELLSTSWQYYKTYTYHENSLHNSVWLAPSLARRQVLLRGILLPARDAWETENKMHGRPVMSVSRFARGMSNVMQNEQLVLPIAGDQLDDQFGLGSPEGVYSRYPIAQRAFRLALADMCTFPHQPLVEPRATMILPWYPKQQNPAPDWMS